MLSDKVWILWLISKLTKTAVLSQFVRALPCQLNNRPFTLVGSNSESRRHVAPAGTTSPPPRCSPLGSIFFNIYINYLWTAQNYKNMAVSNICYIHGSHGLFRQLEINYKKAKHLSKDAGTLVQKLEN